MTTAVPNPLKVSKRRWLLPLAVFLLVMAGHAIYMRHEARLPVKVWAADSAIVDSGMIGPCSIS